MEIISSGDEFSRKYKLLKLVKNIGSFHKTSNIERLVKNGIRKYARVRG